MNQSRDDRVGAESVPSEDRRDLDRMGDIVLTRGSGLPGMGLDSKVVRASDRVDIKAVGVALQRPCEEGP